MLIIVNPYATTVSDRLKSLVVYALQGRYEVEAVTTEAQNHATEIGRQAIEVIENEIRKWIDKAKAGEL